MGPDPAAIARDTGVLTRQRGEMTRQPTAGPLQKRARRALANVEAAAAWDPVLVDLAVEVATALDGRSKPDLLRSAVSDASAGIALAREGASGPIEVQVRADLDALTTEHPTAKALRELAVTLARALDGDAGTSVATIAGQLRATLNDLAMHEAGDDDDDVEGDLSEVDDGDRRGRDTRTRVSAKVRNETPPGKGNARRRRR